MTDNCLFSADERQKLGLGLAVMQTAVTLTKGALQTRTDCLECGLVHTQSLNFRSTFPHVRTGSLAVVPCSAGLLVATDV